MDKSKLKKIALMGMAGGMLVASEAPLTAASNSMGAETVIAAHSCGSACGSKGNHSCGSKINQNSCGSKINQSSCGSKRNQSCGAQNPNRPRYGNPTAYDDPEDSSTMTETGKAMSESELMSQLNSNGKATYQSLSPEGKALALKLASQSCKGMNACKGLGSCKSATNSCAGKNGCRGQSAGPFKDKNVAVKVAAQHMAEKRNGMSDQNR